MFSFENFWVQVYVAKDILSETKYATAQDELWERMKNDLYLAYAVQEAYESLQVVLSSLLNEDGHHWFVLYPPIKMCLLTMRCSLVQYWSLKTVLERKNCEKSQCSVESGSTQLLSLQHFVPVLGCKGFSFFILISVTHY